MDRKIIVRRIDELMKKKRITAYELKEHAGISSTIYQWRKNAVREATRSPSLRSIEKVCGFLDVSLSYFFAFGNERESQTHYRVVEIAERMEKLTEGQLNAIEAVVREFERCKE